MSSTTSKVAQKIIQAPRFQSSIRKLQQNGVDALKPTLVITDTNTTSIDRRIWLKPSISKRKVAVLRKQAIVDNQYGTFDPITGRGWDSKWDIDLETTSTCKNNGMGRIRVTVPKLTKRFRTREERATKIELKMIDMKERMEEVYTTRKNSKPTKTFERTYKEMMKVKK